MLSVLATPTERRCKATTKRGERCAGRIVNADGLCTMHAGTTDPRELGRKSGQSRRGGPKSQRVVHEGLREALRAGLDHEDVVAAVRQSLSGGNESARVAAVKFLADLELYRKDGDDCPRCAQVKAEAPAVREKLNRELEAYLMRAVRDHDAGKVSDEQDSQVMTLVRRAVARAREGHEEELQAVVEQALLKTVERLKHNIVVEQDTSPEEAKAVLQSLAEGGVFDHLIEGRMKQEREALDREREELAAQRAEFAGA